MKAINDKFRKHRLGELKCLRMVRRVKGATILVAFSAVALCCFGMAVAAISLVALTFAGLAIIARLYHRAEQHWFAISLLHKYLREERDSVENRASGELTTRIESSPLVNTSQSLVLTG